MRVRPAAWVIFLACAAALIAALVVGAYREDAAAQQRTSAASAVVRPSAGIDASEGSPQPAGDPGARGGEASASAAARNPSLAAAAPAPPTSVSIPPPPTDPLEDPPFTADEKARGVRPVDGGGRVDFKSRTLTLRAQVCIQRGPLELFACAEGGKDHESVLRVRCRPEMINLHLTLFRLKKGPPRPEGGVPAGDRLIVTCEWEQDGRPVSVRAEDMVFDNVTGRAMDRVGWTYVGSGFEPEREPDTGRPTGRSFFKATYGRSIIATYDDPSALINTPLPEGNDDLVFTANDKVVPLPGTPVRMVLRPATEQELAEIRKIESQFDERRLTHAARGKHREESGPDDAPPVPPPGEKENQ